MVLLFVKDTGLLLHKIPEEGAFMFATGFGKEYAFLESSAVHPLASAYKVTMYLPLEV
jgi:hypothetical protein